MRKTIQCTLYYRHLFSITLTSNIKSFDRILLSLVSDKFCSEKATHSITKQYSTLLAIQLSAFSGNKQTKMKNTCCLYWYVKHVPVVSQAWAFFHGLSHNSMKKKKSHSWELVSVTVLSMPVSLGQTHLHKCDITATHLSGSFCRMSHINIMMLRKTMLAHLFSSWPTKKQLLLSLSIFSSSSPLSLLTYYWARSSSRGCLSEALLPQFNKLFFIPPDSSSSVCLHHVYMYLSELSVSLLVFVKDGVVGDVKLGRRIGKIRTSQRFGRGVVDRPTRHVTENQLSQASRYMSVHEQPDTRDSPQQNYELVNCMFFMYLSCIKYYYFTTAVRYFVSICLM